MSSHFQKIVSEPNVLSFALNLTLAILGFAGFALLARSFPLEIFGEWVLYISAAALIEMIRYGITLAAVVRYLPGLEDEERLKLIGSSGFLGVITTIAIALIIWLCHIYFPGPIKKGGYELFFTWYPLLTILKFPYQNALIILQADLEFKKMLFLRSFEAGIFFLFVLVNYVYPHATIEQLIIYQIFINSIVSVFCSVKDWDGLRHLGKTTWKNSRTLLDFGKYATFTIVYRSFAQPGSVPDRIEIITN